MTHTTFKLHHSRVLQARRTCASVPEQYVGKLTSGQWFYFRCRWGCAWLGVGASLDEAVEDAMSRPDGQRWSDDQYAGAFDSTERRDEVFANMLAELV